jgi:hypothetical protein
MGWPIDKMSADITLKRWYFWGNQVEEEMQEDQN